MPLDEAQLVDNWQVGYCHSFDFSSLNDAGEYYVKLDSTHSHTFSLETQLLFKRTFSDLLHYFKCQRCSGIYEESDKNAKVYGSDETRDVSGGWYDASGDVSKYLSHLSYANYLNPQQIPLVVWSLVQSLEAIEHTEFEQAFTRLRLIEEAKFGADFLIRMQHESGFFYMTLFDKWSKDTEQRELCAYQTQDGHKGADYQAGFRQGGGMAIAALAATYRISQESKYLESAELGYHHLKEYNLKYLDNGEANIIDEYCALLACIELFKASDKQEYLAEARGWANALMARQQSDAKQQNFWSASPERPYYHASDAGLPVIALCHYLTVETDDALKQECQQAIQRAIAFELEISQEVANPFAYPRQYVKDVNSEKRSSFFISQNNESGYWWQGENARLGSLSCMGLLAKPLLDDSLQSKTSGYSSQCLNWILGANPFDICMLDGHGRNNPDYLPELGFFNAKGGVCNGITAGFDDPNGITFKPEPQAEDMAQNWRWGEQWIPHAAWFMLAVALTAKEEAQ
ncbi:glucosamine-link cellobiase [Vibrio ishigakensis]|uniref:Glucosamine-link cellobiase n=1 Tax=Vibrio ishigakensis TaxID=1481914 RepID=A0A0B8Q020_9VIBR|nr:glucosamine-link cellobiase [Vibrio ishigakensis]